MPPYRKSKDSVVVASTSPDVSAVSIWFWVVESFCSFIYIGIPQTEVLIPVKE